jgi:hypothetical protein
MSCRWRKPPHGWGPQYGDEVLGREMAKAMDKPGDMLLGRRT